VRSRLCTLVRPVGSQLGRQADSGNPLIRSRRRAVRASPVWFVAWVDRPLAYGVVRHNSRDWVHDWVPIGRTQLRGSDLRTAVNGTFRRWRSSISPLDPRTGTQTIKWSLSGRLWILTTSTSSTTPANRSPRCCRLRGLGLAIVSSLPRSVTTEYGHEIVSRDSSRAHSEPGQTGVSDPANAVQ
jgi:hypothetical protein